MAISVNPLYGDNIINLAENAAIITDDNLFLTISGTTDAPVGNIVNLTL